MFCGSRFEWQILPFWVISLIKVSLLPQKLYGRWIVSFFVFFQKHSTLFTFNIEFERVGSSYRIWEGRIWFPTPYLLRMPIRGFMILLLESCLDFTFLLCLPLLVYHNLELSSYNSWVGHYSKRSYCVYLYWYLSTLIVGLSTREGWCVCPSR